MSSLVLFISFIHAISDFLVFELEFLINEVIESRTGTKAVKYIVHIIPFFV